MRPAILAGACVLALGLLTLTSPPAPAMGLDPAYHGAVSGPQRARGVVVWSHGRSLDAEDYKSPTPAYLRVLHDAGWDVLRFDRLRDSDSLNFSTRRLVAIAAQLKREGYRRIVLAGQSFGAFLALMAADDSDDIDAVVATAPAAFGDFDEFYDTWRLNATRLYPVLDQIKHARVMLFFFHGDDFDPGGRGSKSRAILSKLGPGFAVIDQPAYLVGHWISSSGLFLRRFGDCIRDFIDDDGQKGEFLCHPSWGNEPSAELRLPRELIEPRAAISTTLTAASGASTAVATGADGGVGAKSTWYGVYPNGREVLFAIEAARRHQLTAIYAIGPGIDRNEPAEWSRRTGHIIAREMVFAEKGESTLRFRPREDGGLTVTWTSPDGKTQMEAGLRRIDRDDLASRGATEAQGQ